MELALTGRNVRGEEAAALGLVARCCGSVEELRTAAWAAAAVLADKSPLAVSGTKRVLLHTRCAACSSCCRAACMKRAPLRCCCCCRCCYLLLLLLPVAAVAAAACCRDHPGVLAGLQHVALWNSAFLLSADMQELIAARAGRRRPVFSKL